MEEERCYTVYMHVNKSNEKVYIGLTKMKPEHRWGKDGNGYKGQFFGRAIKKYGWDNFEHIILFENINKEKAEELEILFINILMSNNRTYGYNLENGGNTIGCVSEETKEKISKALMGKMVSGKHPQAKKVICDGKIFNCAKDCADYYGIKTGTLNLWLNGKNGMPEEFFNKGLKYLESECETRLPFKMSRGDNPFAKKIICNGEVYNCMTDLADLYNIDSGNISNWISGRVSIPKKYKIKELRYLDDNSGICLIHDTKEVDRTVYGKKVTCDNIEFKSIKECAEYYNISKANMSKWLTKEVSMPKKFIEMNLRYFDDETTIYEEKIRGVKVVCNNKIFNSVKECADYYNKKYSTFCNWLNGTYRIPQEFINLGLRYLDDNTNTHQDEIKTKKRKAICEDKIFNSIKECADYYSIKYTTMLAWLRGQNSTPQNFKDLGLRYYIEEVSEK